MRRDTTATTAASGDATTSLVAEQAADADRDMPEPEAAEVLVEEISIDGMCGVY